jgi:hypothetical protein
MKILIDENRYLTCFCIDAELDGGIEVETPEDIDAFIDAFRAYKYENGQLVLDKDKLQVLDDERIADELRRKRAKICFPCINRGDLWYSRLSAEQRYELDVWYDQWLNVTTTRVIPEKPDWLIL